METDGARANRITSLPLAGLGRPSGPVRGPVAAAREIWSYRDLLFRLIRREIGARYKGSGLGVVWALVRPLVQLAIYYVAVGKFLNAAQSVPDFAIFIFSGLTIWGLFNEILSSATGSVVGNAGLVKKVYLPREIFPLAAMGGAFFNFLVQLGILFAATILLGVAPWHVEILYLPLSIAVIAVFATAIAFFTSALNVYLRDVSHLVEVAMLVLFWASPILYAAAFVHSVLGGGWLESVYLANPITLGVLGMQKAMWTAGSLDTSQFWPDDLALRMFVALGVSLVLLWIGQRVFARLQGSFAQEL